jgi:hypothetical protein
MGAKESLTAHIKHHIHRPFCAGVRSQMEGNSTRANLMARVAHGGKPCALAALYHSRQHGPKPPIMWQAVIRA